MSLPKNWKQWLVGIESSFVGGGAGAVSATFANLTVDVTTGNAIRPSVLLYRFGVTFLIAGVIHLMIFLSKNPAPAEPNGGNTP